MSVYVKQADDTWKNISSLIKTSDGVWKPIKNIYEKDEATGVWKPTWSYSYVTGDYGSCSASCGGGTQTRTVTCTRNDGIALPDTYCSELTKPATSTSCNTQSCVSYNWYTGSFGNCSVSCGNGYRYRSVYCRRNDGTSVADSFCSGNRPADSESCYAGVCYSYSKVYGTWGTCQPLPLTSGRGCGQFSGTKTRSVTCKRNDGVIVGNSYCNSTDTEDVYCPLCNECAFDEAAVLNNKVKQLYVNNSPWPAELAAKMRSKFGNDILNADNSYNMSWISDTRRLKSVILSDAFVPYYPQYSTVQAWYNNFGENESVCPWPNSYCCGQAGYTYH